ncbi:MAG: acetyl-CoA carboxylase [Actinomycetota bacterium]
MREPTPDELLEILRIFADSDLRQLHLHVGNVQVSVSKDDVSGTPVFAPATAVPAPETEAAEAVAEPSAAAQSEERPGLLAIRSPLLGVFYRRPAPEKPPYVDVGDVVEPDTPVCTISVMKMFTEVQAGHAGKVVEILVEDDALVEEGQVLMYVDEPPG